MKVYRWIRRLLGIWGTTKSFDTAWVHARDPRCALLGWHILINRHYNPNRSCIEYDCQRCRITRNVHVVIWSPFYWDQDITGESRHLNNSKEQERMNEFFTPLDRLYLELLR